MLKCVLLARLEAKPGEEEALAQAPVAKAGELLAKPPSIEPDQHAQPEERGRHAPTGKAEIRLQARLDGALFEIV
jgi:hypothetical protein